MSVQYKAFQTTEEADAWVKKYKSFFPSDTDEDKIFIQAIDYYTGMLKPIYNNHLRQHFPIKEANFFYPYLTRMVEKLPTYQIPDNIVVYRYIDKQLLKEICKSYPPKCDSIMQDKGFMSVTLLQDSVWQLRRDKKLNVLLVISVPKGTKGTYVDLLHDSLPEYEIILAPNTKLHIDNKMPFLNNRLECTVVN